MKTISARSVYPAVLGRLHARLEQLWLRLDELQAAEARREGWEVALSTRLDDLAEDVRRLQEEVAAARQWDASVRPAPATAPDRDGALGQVDGERVPSGTGRQPDPDGPIGELTDRLDQLEDRVGGLLARLEPLPQVPSPAVSGAAEALSRRLDELGGVLRAQGERLHHLEERPPGDAGPSVGAPPADPLEHRRLEALEGELEALRQQVAEPRDGWHRRTEDRLAKLDRRVGTGLALVSLLALSLAAAGWWWTRSSIEVLESRQPPVVATAPAVVPPDALAQGVAALEQVRAEADGFLKHTERLIALIERHSDAQVEAQERMIGLLESLPLSTEAGSPLRILPADVGMPEPEPVESAGRTGVSTTGEGAGPSAAPDQLLRDPDAGDAAPTPAVEEGGVSVPPPDRPPGPVTALTEEGTIAGLWGVSPEALADLESDLPQEAGSDVAPPAQEADSGISTPQDAQPEVGLDAAGPPVPDAAGPDSGPGAGAGQDAAGARGPLVLTEERYIVQLIGFRTRGSVAAFAEEMGIRSEARYLEMRFGGRPWYGVILGNYASEAEAEAAAEAMPQTLRDLDPWIRSIPPGSELLPIE